MIPPVMLHFRKLNTIVLTRSHLRTGAVGVASTLALLAVPPAAHADFLVDTGSTVFWNGGFATNTGGGWYGQGWDRFPGVNPPWNPVNGRIGGGLGGFGSGFGSGLDAGFGFDGCSCGHSVRPMPAPQVRVVVVPIREPRPVRQLSLSFNGEDVPLQGSGWSW